MTNLDVICGVLSRVTHRPEQRFRQVICASIETGVIPTGKLLEESPGGDDLARYLVASEAAGILNWAIRSGIMARAVAP